MSIFVKMQNCVKWQTDTCLSVQNPQKRPCFFIPFATGKSNHQQSGKMEFGGVPPLSPSHHLVRESTHMNCARYRSLSDKLEFEDLSPNYNSVSS